MKKLFNICNVYVSLWFIMQLSGWLYKQDIISMLALLGIYIISGYYVFEYAISAQKPQFLKSFSWLFLIFVLYGIVNILFLGAVKTSWNVIPSDFYLQNIMKSMMPVYAFYAFAKRGYLTKKWFFYASFIFLLITVPRYIIAEEKAIEILLTKDTNREEVTNNAGYMFVALIPMFVFLEKKPVFQYILMAVSAYFIVSAMKRGAILIGGISFAYFFYSSTRNISMRKKMLYLILIGLFVTFCYFYVNYMMESSTYFESRVNDTIEGNDSNRSSLYSDFWNKIVNEGDVFTFLFGKGADATIRYGENYAHNDWLEIAMDIGLLGIISFIIFWKSFYRFWKSFKNNPTLYLIVGICFIQMFSKTFFSMSINKIEISLSCVLGYAIYASQNRIVFNEDKENENTLCNQ